MKFWYKYEKNADCNSSLLYFDFRNARAMYILNCKWNVIRQTYPLNGERRVEIHTA